MGFYDVCKNFDNFDMKTKTTELNYNFLDICEREMRRGKKRSKVVSIKQQISLKKKSVNFNCVLKNIRRKLTNYVLRVDSCSNDNKSKSL